MLEDESIIELMLAIGQHDFFVGEALLVVKNGVVFLVYLILEAGLLLPSKHLNMKLYQYF
jgi:hypothetical protein